jgi:hypothetical protein
VITLQLREDTSPSFGEITLASLGAGVAQPTDVLITGDAHTRRPEVEQFICDIYKQSYDATIDVRYPTLMSIQDEQGTLLAAMGLRDAGRERLFLETYLDVPVEEAIFRATGEKVERSQIVEVGNLASLGSGAAQYLYLAFHAYAFELGYRYVVVTATTPLKTTFRRMKIETFHLVDADASRLIDGGVSWGSYYATEPQVITGNIRQGLHSLLLRYGARYLPHATPLRAKLHIGQSGGHA